jgi:hypothetical protein
MYRHRVCRRVEPAYFSRSRLFVAALSEIPDPRSQMSARASGCRRDNAFEKNKPTPWAGLLLGSEIWDLCRYYIQDHGDFDFAVGAEHHGV